VPVYNLAHTLPQALESVLRQSVTDFELIIVNDGSTDETEEVVSRYQTLHPDIVVIQHGHSGASASRNRALQIARGTFVAFLDADDVWTLDKLCIQISHMQRFPSMDLTFTNHRYLEACGVSSDTRRERVGLIREPSLLDLILERPIAFSTVVARRTKILTVGGFDEELESCEDYDLYYRMLLAGMTIRLLDRDLARVRLRAGSLSDNLALYRKSMKRVWQKILDTCPLTPNEANVLQKELSSLAEVKMPAREIESRMQNTHPGCGKRRSQTV